MLKRFQKILYITNGLFSPCPPAVLAAVVSVCGSVPASATFPVVPETVPAAQRRPKVRSKACSWPFKVKKTTTNQLCSSFYWIVYISIPFPPPQEWGGEVCRVLSEVCGADTAERREGGQTFPNGDRLHPAEKPLPPLTAVQHPSALHEQHLPGKAQHMSYQSCSYLVFFSCLYLKDTIYIFYSSEANHLV